MEDTMKRKLISFRPYAWLGPRWHGRGCYFKVHVEQESGGLYRKKMLNHIHVRKAWSGASLFRARLEDEDLVNDVTQHMLDDVLERVGYPWRSGPGARW